MNPFRPVPVSRAGAAFAPRAAELAMAVFPVLALACGMALDSRAAEPDAGSVLQGDTKVEDPALEWAKMAAGSLPERSKGVVMPMAIPRTSLPSTDRTFIIPRTSLGPSQEWMGMSKLVIPLLVIDLVDDRTAQAARATVVQAVDAGR